MDFNDSDPTKIFLDNDYNELPTPTITRPDYGSDDACQSGSEFQLNNLPDGFSVSWQVSPSGYFNSPISGTTTIAKIYPSTQYTGVECSIIYTISDGCGSATYSKNFTINGPLWSKVSINVVESYANPPVLFREVWLLCPNSSYYIYLINNSGCTKDIQEGMKIKTDGLSSNYYYLVLKYKGKIYTEKIRIEK